MFRFAAMREPAGQNSRSIHLGNRAAANVAFHTLGRSIHLLGKTCYASDMSSATHDSLTLEQVQHVAKLARLRLTPQQLETYRVQLSSILHHVAKLSELDVEGVEPVAHPNQITNRLDDDVVGRSMELEALLRNAPAVEDRYLAVPKVLADE
jgi:aspartyl-tRNA(Asn)/glutamyl-tRNA(Gln) amidotransferase subunit C